MCWESGRLKIDLYVKPDLEKGSVMGGGEVIPVNL